MTLRELADLLGCRLEGDGDQQITRVAALGISAIMVGAVLMVHLPHGFFMNWFGNQSGEGFEFHLLALALSVPLLMLGGGRYALDSKLLSWLRAARLPRSGRPRTLRCDSCSIRPSTRQP